VPLRELARAQESQPQLHRSQRAQAGRSLTRLAANTEVTRQYLLPDVRCFIILPVKLGGALGGAVKCGFKRWKEAAMEPLTVRGETAPSQARWCLTP
jgi:hypothetical protein